MSEEKKKRLKEYKKNYREAKESQYNNDKIILIVIQIKQFLIVIAILIVIQKNSFF